MRFRSTNPAWHWFLVVAFSLVPVSMVMAQEAPAHAYSVVTVKPSPTDGPRSMIGFSNRPDGIHGENATVLTMIHLAFDGLETDSQVLDAPKWAQTERFHVDARMSDADIAAMPSLGKEEKDKRRAEMMQALLADRFHLKAHTETRQMPVYELVVAKDGPKLKEFEPGNELKGPTGKPIPGGWLMFMQGKARGQAVTMESLTSFLAQQASIARPVVDKTGLKATYNFELTMTATPPAGLEVKIAPTEDEPSIFTAVQEDLGLKLQSATGMVKVVVIDHVEQPSEN